MLINSSVEFNGRIAPNRIMIHPMEGCDGNKDGSIGELTRRRYLRFAQSGAGIIWFEATAVCEEGRANPRQLWLNENNLDSFKALLAEIRAVSVRENGFEPIIIMQATHSGRYSKPDGTPRPIVAYRNSVYEENKEDYPYYVITDRECDEIIEKFAKSAILASKAGFDGVDVKCCHGYLFNEFLSAYSRAGRYGGSLENRTALYYACIEAVKKNISKGMFVTTRLNAYDGFSYPYGFGADDKANIELTETKKIIAQLQNMGIELINITIGNPYLIPEVNRPYIGGSEDGMIGVRRVVGVTDELQKTFPQLKMALSAVTYLGVDALQFAEECLENNSCSIVGFGRMAFAYPQFYKDFCLHGKLDKNKVCIKCGNCSKMMRAGGVAGCPIRDQEIYLPLYRKYVEGKNE